MFIIGVKNGKCFLFVNSDKTKVVYKTKVVNPLMLFLELLMGLCPNVNNTLMWVKIHIVICLILL